MNDTLELSYKDNEAFADIVRQMKIFETENRIPFPVENCSFGEINRDKLLGSP